EVAVGVVREPVPLAAHEDGDRTVRVGLETAMDRGEDRVPGVRAGRPRRRPDGAGHEQRPARKERDPASHRSPKAPRARYHLVSSFRWQSRSSSYLMSDEGERQWPGG